MRRQGSSSGDFVRVIGMVAGIFVGACSGKASLSPTSPAVAANTAQSAIGANGGPGLPFIAVTGTGSGRFNLVHTESDRDGFTADAQLTISVEGVAPNTLLYLLRAGDLGLPGGQQADGVCQRAAAGLSAPARPRCCALPSAADSLAFLPPLTRRDDDPCDLGEVARFADELGDGERGGRPVVPYEWHRAAGLVEVELERPVRPVRGVRNRPDSIGHDRALPAASVE